MAYIIETPNAFQPLLDVKKHCHPGGITIRGWLTNTKPGFVEFDNPTICLINGKPVMRKDWSTREIRRDDIVNFVTTVGEVITIIALIIAVILIAVSLAITLSMRNPTTPGAGPAARPVWSAGQQNSVRLGEPIECNYGRNRIYPSMASRPFYRYSGNNQYQYSLFCIGQGYYDFTAIQIGDTAIANFQEVEYEIIEPGNQSTLFKTNVHTSDEAGGQTLYAFNDPEWVYPGFVGPFVACEPGSQVNRIDINFIYPKGVYKMDSKTGQTQSITVNIEFQYRLIDNSGAPLGPWQTLFFDSFFANTTTPLRRTRATAVAAGRYEVRGHRPEDRVRDSTYGNEVAWEGMLGYKVGGEPTYGNLTLLAVKIRASNNLNSSSQAKFNVICTRKLAIRNPSTGDFSAPIATRSIVWAFVDVFMAFYGGQVTESYFDWDALDALDALYESRNEHFDWTFRDPITVWDAASAIARVGRAVPLLMGSLISMRRDGPQTIPVTLYNPDNMIQGTFEWDIQLWKPQENDSIRVEYTESSTGYTQENVLCILPGGTGDNPIDLRLIGIQNRDHAYHEGLYTLASQKYLRENIMFETGMEGFLPGYGDLVAVSHDVPRWGQSGYIMGVENESGSDIYHLHLSEPVSFEESGDYQIILRAKNGGIVGPVTAFENSDPKVVTVIIGSPVDFLLGGTTEPMLFLFGPSGQVTKYGRIVKIEPLGGERIRITLVNDAPALHTFDSLSAPALTFPSLPPVVPDLPTVTGLQLTQIDGANLIIQASWLPAFGAQYYIVETSTDATNWQSRGDTTRTSIQLQVQPGLIYVRVAAVNQGQGPWLQSNITVGLVSGLAVTIPWDDLQWAVAWWQNPSVADGWRVKVYDDSHSAPILKRTEDLSVATISYLYDYAKALVDGNLVRDMLLEVDVLAEDQTTHVLAPSGAPSQLTFHNNIPQPPYHTGDVFLHESSTGGAAVHFFWDLPAELDTHRVRLWISNSPIFDPTDTGTLFYEFTSTVPGYTHLPQDVILDVPDGYVYWWVGVFDVWGEETIENTVSSGGVAGNVSDMGIITVPWILYAGDWIDVGRWEDTDVWNDS